LQTLLRDIGDPDPAAGAGDVFAFERRLAQAQWEPAANRESGQDVQPDPRLSICPTSAPVSLGTLPLALASSI